MRVCVQRSLILYTHIGHHSRVRCAANKLHCMCDCPVGQCMLSHARKVSAQHKTQCERPYVIYVVDNKLCGAQKHNHTAHSAHHRNPSNSRTIGIVCFTNRSRWISLNLLRHNITRRTHFLFNKQLYPKLKEMIKN